MYEVVKRYETYVAHNKCLEGKSASPHIGHQRAVAQISGYKPHSHKTTAFATSVKGSPDPTPSEQEPSFSEEDDHLKVEPTLEGDEGLYIPSFLEDALGGDGNLQIKMAHTNQETMKESTQQMETMENSTEIPGLVSYQTLHYFFGIKTLHYFTLCISARNVKQLNSIYIVVQEHYF